MRIQQVCIRLTFSTKMPDVFALVIVLDHKIFSISIRYINVAIGSNDGLRWNVFFRLGLLTGLFRIVQRHQYFPIQRRLKYPVQVVITNEQHILSVFIE